MNQGRRFGLETSQRSNDTWKERMSLSPTHFKEKQRHESKLPRRVSGDKSKFQPSHYVPMIDCDRKPERSPVMKKMSPLKLLLKNPRPSIDPSSTPKHNFIYTLISINMLVMYLLSSFIYFEHEIYKMKVIASSSPSLSNSTLLTSPPFPRLTDSDYLPFMHDIEAHDSPAIGQIEEVTVTLTADVSETTNDLPSMHTATSEDADIDLEFDDYKGNDDDESGAVVSAFLVSYALHNPVPSMAEVRSTVEGFLRFTTAAVMSGVELPEDTEMNYLIASFLESRHDDVEGKSRLLEAFVDFILSSSETDTLSPRTDDPSGNNDDGGVEEVSPVDEETAAVIAAFEREYFASSADSSIGETITAFLRFTTAAILSGVDLPEGYEMDYLISSFLESSDDFEVKSRLIEAFVKFSLKAETLIAEGDILAETAPTSIVEPDLITKEPSAEVCADDGLHDLRSIMRGFEDFGLSELLELFEYKVHEEFLLNIMAWIDTLSSAPPNVVRARSVPSMGIPAMSILAVLSVTFLMRLIFAYSIPSKKYNRNSIVTAKISPSSKVLKKVFQIQRRTSPKPIKSAINEDPINSVTWRDSIEGGGNNLDSQICAVETLKTDETAAEVTPKNVAKTVTRAKKSAVKQTEESVAYSTRSARRRADARMPMQVAM